jgi:regulator of sirC expression with transglutaminase-like and TPR domain
MPMNFGPSFNNSRLIGNRKEYDDPRNSDLAWSIAEGRSNPLGLCLIFMLVGRRLGFEIEGINFPGHFMCRIYEDGSPLIVDCFEQGQLHLQSTLLESPELSRAQRSFLSQTAAPGAILLRLIGNLHQALEKAGRSNDALLIKELLASLV